MPTLETTASVVNKGAPSPRPVVCEPATPLTKRRLPTLRERLAPLHEIGALLLVTGVLMLVPLFFHWLDSEALEHGLEAVVYYLPAGGSILTGLFLQKIFPRRELSVRDAMLVTALGWVVVCAFGAVPFMIGLGASPIDALFESVSGFTTTGITVFQGLDDMPRSILLWRSIIQWLGGLGILAFFLVVGFRSGSAAATLFSAEGHKIGGSRPVPGIHNTVKALWKVYLILTCGALVAFLMGGMDLFDAVCHTMTCVSTGGFSTHDASMGYYASRGFTHAVFIEYAAIVFMLTGGMNFLVHFKVFHGEVGSLWRDFEMRWFWGLVAGFTVVILGDHFLHAPLRNGGESLATDLRTVLFQVSSMITSTGFATRDIGDPFFPAVAKQLFLVLMIIGGCVGSTAGGIKVLRLGILVNMLRNQVHKLTATNRTVTPVTVHGQIIPDFELQRIGALLGGWLLLIGLGSLVTAWSSDLDAWQSLSGMASAVGNMGPFYFSVPKMASLHWIIKSVYIIGMLAGRLEILPLVVLVSRRTWRSA